MYCVNCGTELPDEANFCWKCGIAQPGASEVLAHKWEYCEILAEDASFRFWARFRFSAKAVGPQGTYMAARSPETFSSPDPYSSDRKHVAACDALVQKLVRDGWEPISEKGPRWYSYKFRRPVRD